eukprot:1540669-Pleurochrysis_carterae.AAC.2
MSSRVSSCTEVSSWDTRTRKRESMHACDSQANLVQNCSGSTAAARSLSRHARVSSALTHTACNAANLVEWGESACACVRRACGTRRWRMTRTRFLQTCSSRRELVRCVRTCVRIAGRRVACNVGSDSLGLASVSKLAPM